MTNKNLEEYSQFLRQKSPQFTLRSLLQSNDVILEPEASFVLDGAVRVVRNMVENTKRFVRYYKGKTNQMCLDIAAFNIFLNVYKYYESNDGDQKYIKRIFIPI